MTELLEELEEKRDNANSRAEKFMILRDRKNGEAKQWLQKRDELNAKVRELIDRGNELKEERNQLNDGVHEAKRIRNEMNKKVKDVSRKLREKKKELLPKEGPSLDELDRDIRRLEYQQMTNVLKTEKERELVDKISHLKAQIDERKRLIEDNDDIKALTAELEYAKEEAEKNHELLSERADLAQIKHDNMLECFNKAEEIRVDADKAHEKFIDSKVKADEYHHQHIQAVNDVQDYSKILWGLKKKKRTAKKRRDEEDTIQKAEQLYEQFKKGEKLGTEDIMTLQKAGLL